MSSSRINKRKSKEMEKDYEISALTNNKRTSCKNEGEDEIDGLVPGLGFTNNTKYARFNKTEIFTQIEMDTIYTNDTSVHFIDRPDYLNICNTDNTQRKVRRFYLL